jgi:hypothetical protein
MIADLDGALDRGLITALWASGTPTERRSHLPSPVLDLKGWHDQSAKQ